MNKNVMTIIPLVLAVSGCGGSGGNSSSELEPVVVVEEVPTNTVLRRFADGSVISRATLVENRQRYVIHYFSPVDAEFDPSVVTNLAEFDGDISYFDSNEYGDFYDGTITIDGEVVEVGVYEDNEQENAMAYFSAGNELFVFAGGAQATNLPSGLYTYRGTNVVGARDTDWLELGTFTMDVDFTNGLASINANSDTTILTGNNISINTADGTFSNSNLTLEDTFYETTASTSIEGSFTGNGATGVTGVYTTTEEEPVVGAIVGRR